LHLTALTTEAGAVSKPLPNLTGNPKADRVFLALARLAIEVVRGEQAAKTHDVTKINTA
jgi:hypothetical protein